MSRQLLILFAVPIPVLACAQRPAVDASELNDIVGSWTGGMVLEYQRPDSQVNLFSLREDGSLALTLIYEVGPRARLWSYDIDVEYSDGIVSWGYHEGRLNPARDTMWVSKDYRGDRSEWMWVRTPGSDSLMEQLRQPQEAPFVLTVPPEEDDGWECAEPETVGLDGAGLTNFLERVAAGDFGDIHSFLIARHGTLVVEEYFAERGRLHGPLIAPVFRNRVHHLASTTKSITSALVGIAIEHGFINSVRDPIGRYLPTYASVLTEEKGRITIEHLLTMSSGLEWVQSSRSRNDAAALWRCTDVLECYLEKPLIAEPGQRFVYSNGSANLVGAILENATDMELGSFAVSRLFRPLGISDYLWTSYPDGTVETDGGLALRPRDLAKVGQLFLNDGRWGSTSVVPSSWVASATEQRFALRNIGDAPFGYGYFWMQTQLPTNYGMTNSYFHGGDGGQLLMVIPELEMVVVFTAGTYGTDVRRVYHAIMSEHVLPALHP